MNIWPRSFRLSIFLGLLLSVQGCPAGPRMLDAVVRQSGDVPCFSVSRQDIRRDEFLKVGAIYVTEIGAMGEVLSTPWHAGFVIPGRKLMISESVCVRYGNPGVEHQGQAPAQLEAGRRYDVFINAAVKRGARWDNRRYDAKFCLTQDARGRVAVRQVHWNKKSAEWGWYVCGFPGARRGTP